MPTPEVTMQPMPQPPAAFDRTRELADALQLIAFGTADEKARYIAERDADWFVDHVLNFATDYVDRDAVDAPRPAINREMLDRGIARLALRDRTFTALRAAG